MSRFDRNPKLLADAAAAWFSHRTRAEICSDLGVTYGVLGLLWDTAKKAGTIPGGDRRAYLGTPQDENPEADNESPRSIKPGRDPLLEALQREHGSDPRRAFDDLTEQLERQKAAQERGRRRKWKLHAVAS